MCHPHTLRQCARLDWCGASQNKYSRIRTSDNIAKDRGKYMLDNFSDDIMVLPSGIKLRVRTAGDGPPVLLLHGYPQTHLCWDKVAPKLVEAGFRVILSDLRGYGDSDKPKSKSDHSTYSKRAMGADQYELMQMLGYEKFAVAGHDRGARVAHRMARDYPDHISAVSVLDIVPTEYMYENTERELATGYYHWFFLIQPAPYPEKMIGHDPDYYLRSKLSGWSKGNQTAFDEEVVKDYVRCFSDPLCIHATCEDYRAGASIDLEHDSADRAARIQMPVQALWGQKGLVDKLYNVLDIWRGYAEHVEGKGINCGHFLPEEQPQETAENLIRFFKMHHGI